MIALLVVDVVLFVVANAAYNHAGFLRSVSNVAWVAFLVGVVLLIILGVELLLRSRHTRVR